MNDTAFSYGAGGGISLEVATRRSARWLDALVLNADVRYLLGGEAECLDRRPAGDGSATIDTRCARTSLLTPEIGFTFRF